MFHHMKLEGDKAGKLARLRDVSLLDPGWAECPSDWQAPLRPVDVEWHKYPALPDLMPWRSRGMTTGRPWAYAPQQETLQMRWDELLHAGTDRRRELFEEKPGRTGPLTALRAHFRVQRAASHDSRGAWPLP